MTNCIADRSQVKNVIRNQQRKLGEEMKMIVKQKATQSRYPALSRSEKRVISPKRLQESRTPCPSHCTNSGTPSQRIQQNQRPSWQLQLHQHCWYGQ